MKTLISIIVPVYNTSSYLPKCLDSILAQTLTDFEVIVVNDGSTDNSGNICDEYALKDNRIRVIHKENGGLSSARNAGLKTAKGKYIGFVDSDDYLHEEMYKKLYSLCKETNSDISICQFNREINGKPLTEIENDFVIKMNHDEAMRNLFKGVLYRFSVCNKLFKKTCFDGITFPEGRIHEDLSTTYKVFARSNKSVYTAFQGYVYVNRENSILTSKYNKKRLDSFKGWEEILLYMNERYPHVFDEVLCCFAYGSVDNIHYILNQVNYKKDKVLYLNVIKKLVSKYFIKLMKNNSLSIKHKLTLTLLIGNIDLLMFSSKTKRLRLRF